MRDAPTNQGTQSLTPAFTTALDYVVQFYPLWFTYHQSLAATHNRFVGPLRISPLYRIVVAINDDTLYASNFLDVAAQPVIPKIPRAKATYSLLTLDPYGDIFGSGIPAGKPGTYGFTGPGFTGKLPAGVTPIAMPLDFQSVIFRVDKYSPTGESEIKEADMFRRSLRMQALCDYLERPCPNGCRTTAPAARP
jgi:hypothetical protein